MRVFVSLQGLHDGELCIVLEPPGLLAENLPQNPQSQCSDHMLGELERFKFKTKGISLGLFAQCYHYRL